MNALKSAFSTLSILAACSTGAVLLSGCSPATVNPDTSVTARLDQENLQIILPLDEYLATEEEMNVTSRARQGILRTCLQVHGQNGLPPVADSQGPGAERTYGIWNSERAAAQGFVGSQAADPVPPAPPGGWSNESDPLFNEVYDRCMVSHGAAMTEVSIPEDVTSESVVEGIRREAYDLASRNPAWSTAREDWRQCITDQGLTARDDDQAWTSQQTLDLLMGLGEGPPSDEVRREEIRLAVIEATCNDQTGLTQRLGDLEAGYQAALMKGKEAALVAERSAHQKFIDAARDYLATHQ